MYVQGFLLNAPGPALSLKTLAEADIISLVITFIQLAKFKPWPLDPS